MHLAAGDSLLHGRHFFRRELGGPKEGFRRIIGHHYSAEDSAEIDQLLGRQYHAVVGNPPYITPKDPAMRDAYREIYDSCHMKYGLGAPFIERFFDLALASSDEQAAGFIGLIVSNSFMKREFGKKLIEEVLPRLDLAHVIDCSGAYIPGHGTPTVILFGRNRAPVGNLVRAVMGIRGEPSTPADAARGAVWSAITEQADVAGSSSDFVSVADIDRGTLAHHPWSIGGGGASELKIVIEEDRQVLGSLNPEIGFASFPGTDDVFVASAAAYRRLGVPDDYIRPMIVGDQIRDFLVEPGEDALIPYDRDQLLIPLEEMGEGASAALGVQVSAEDHLVSLDGTFRPQPPVGATLKEALAALLDSTFAHRFPAHPIFEQEVKAAALNKVLKEIESAAEEPQQRRFIEDRAVRQILGGFAGPLKLGTMNQGLTHFILDDHWANHFTRLAAQQGGGAMTVKRLRALIDQPRTMGLPREVENLIILACAAQADRTMSLRGAPVRGTIERLDDDAELLAQPLPEETIWTKARERAAEVFGLAPSEVRKGATVARLASELREKAQAGRAPLTTLTSVLRTRMADVGLTPENTPRMITLLSASVLVTELTAGVEPLTVVQSLATSDLRTSEAAVGRAISAAGGLVSFLRSSEWDVLAAAIALSDHRRVAAEQIGRSVAEALEADEHVLPLEARLREVQRTALLLLAAAAPRGVGSGASARAVTADTGNRPPTGGAVPGSGLYGPDQSPEVLEERAWVELPVQEAAAELDRLKSRLGTEPDARLSISWRLTRDGAKG